MAPWAPWHMGTVVDEYDQLVTRVYHDRVVCGCYRRLARAHYSAGILMEVSLRVSYNERIETCQPPGCCKGVQGPSCLER